MKVQKIWPVEFPTYRYEQDVKDLARRSDLRVIDKKMVPKIDEKLIGGKLPKLTLKKKYRPIEEVESSKEDK